MKSWPPRWLSSSNLRGLTLRWLHPLLVSITIGWQLLPWRSPPYQSELMAQDRTAIAQQSRPKRNGSVNKPRFQLTAEPELSDERLARAGVRLLRGKHLLLYTDLPDKPEVNELPLALEQALPGWCQVLGLDEKDFAQWRLVGCLMQDSARFSALQLLPRDVPEFKHGFSRGDRFWLREQTSAYYRRHLLLHEAVHGLCDTSGLEFKEPWAQEGIAEFLATHHWQAGTMQAPWFPNASETVSRWGRIEMLSKARQARKPLTAVQVFGLDNKAHLQVEPYAWCWAWFTFCEGHSRYQPDFADWLQHPIPQREAKWERHLHPQSNWQLQADWAAFVADADYGYSFARNALDFPPDKSLEASAKNKGGPPSDQVFTLQADHGWQLTPWHVAAGKRYHLKAKGSFTLASEPQVWRCEPQGVTVEFYRERPLGELQLTVLPMTQAEIKVANAVKEDGTKVWLPFLDRLPAGSGLAWTPAVSGVVYLKVNDRPGQLEDNTGSIQVELNELPSDKSGE